MLKKYLVIEFLEREQRYGSTFQAIRYTFGFDKDLIKYWRWATKCAFRYGLITRKRCFKTLMSIGV